MSGSQKIQRAHLERLAIVYLRQSSPRQVRENFRSTERQYGLAEKAAQLGWEPARVLTVDADLGISGRGTHAREAYKELVGRVCLGEVGAIFGLEVARLARNNAELLRLLEFCAVTDTLVVDTDGIYDLKDFNDRTILGLKAQWSEAELHIMASRLQGAKRHAAERGELRLPLPIGYLYDDEGSVILDPDEEVQAAVTDLFRAFAQTGSAYGVVGVFKDRRFPKRVHAAPWTGELRRERLRYSRVRQALTNPCYAGAYAFGRHRSRRAVTPEGTIVTKKAALPRAEWAVLIHDHHPAYISWDAFLANHARLAANHTSTGERPPREGSALCQGIVSCGSCGRTMGTHYQRGTVAYKCSRSRLEHLNTPGCREVKTAVVDELVARGCCKRSHPSRSRSRSPPPTRSQNATPAPTARSSCASNAPAMTRSAPNARSTPASRTTASSLGPSRPAGKPSSANSGTPRRSSPRRPRRRPSHHASRSRRSRTTCPRYGPRTAPPTRTASDCYARSSTTSRSPASHTATSSRSGSAGAQAPASSTPSSDPSATRSRRPHST